MKNRNDILLGVNIDHVATLRQARYKDYSRTFGQMVEPDPLRLALASELGGADGITLHLREDRRHIQEEDVKRIRASIQTRLNLEMACTEEMVRFAREIKPDAVCLVPENRDEVTTEGGLDIIGQEERVQPVINALKLEGIEVSLFIDPVLSHIEKAADLEAPIIEIHTGAFANNYYKDSREAEFEKLYNAAEKAKSLGLTVNAGHGINYVNIKDICQLPHLHELNIGHSIIARALLSGMDEAVREMKILMNSF